MSIINREVSRIDDKDISNNLSLTKNEEKEESSMIKGHFSKTSSCFNPMTHIPPKYNIYGYLLPLNKRKQDMSILNKINNIKMPWCEINSNKSGVKTQIELIKKRKKETIPDISYDLDKDGYVGGQDYVIAKRYDIDCDGKLNEKEKKAAYEGIKNGVEDNYIWNIDKLGGIRKLRLKQVRGKFIEAEDFSPIRDTYPIHPLSKNNPKCLTFTDLKKLRKEENIKSINEKIIEYEKNQIIKNKDIEDKNKKSPKYNSINEIRAELKKQNRMNCGLSPEMTDNRNNILKPPSLAYIYSPNHKTKEDIDNERHKENILESIKIASTKHKSDIERLNEREDEIFSNLYSINSRKTFTEIKEQRKKIENDYNIKTFSKQTLGVHGHELPKFSENEKLKYFWKNKTNYCENPKYKSQRKYLESIKYYKPPGEELYLNEKCEEETKWIDPFKKEYHPISEIKKKDLITNLNEINIFNNFDPKVNKEIEYNPKSKHTYRWSTNVYKFAPNKFKKGRYFEVLPEKRGNLSEDKDTFDNIE